MGRDGYCGGTFRYGDTSRGSRFWDVWVYRHKETRRWYAAAALNNTVNYYRPAHYGPTTGNLPGYPITGLTCVDNVITGSFTLPGTNEGYDGWCNGEPCEPGSNYCCCEGATMTITLGGLP